jgi:hypothetical protein
VQGDEVATESAAPVETTSPADVPSQVSADESSSAESSGEQTKETLLEAVLKVVPTTTENAEEKDSEDEDAPTSEEDGSEAEVKAEGTEKAETPADDDEVPQDAPPKTRKRMNKLLRERTELRNQVASLQPNAEIGEQLNNYVAANNLSGQDVIFALDLAGMVARGDYQGFYQVISPLVRHAQEVTGIVLPPDIQNMVEQQQMTPEAARQYAQSRFERADYEVKARNLEQMRSSQQSASIKDTVQRSVSALEARLAANDPDWKAKADDVRRTSQAMLFERGGRIDSVEDALKIVNAAYAEVNKRARRFQPAARATAPTPGSSNHQTGSTRAAPKTMMEAALAAMQKS